MYYPIKTELGTIVGRDGIYSEFLVNENGMNKNFTKIWIKRHMSH